jgi:hypothetical protein
MRMDNNEPSSISNRAKVAVVFLNYGRGIQSMEIKDKCGRIPVLIRCRDVIAKRSIYASNTNRIKYGSLRFGTSYKKKK